MSMIFTRALVLASLFMTLSLPVNAENTLPAPASGALCDESCLRGFVDDYLTSLVAQDVSRLPLSTDFVYTENTVRLNPGLGLWTTVTGLGEFRIYMEDIYSSVAGFYGVVMENDRPVLMAVRLLVKNGEIKEIEAITTRQEVTGSAPLPADMPTRLARPIWNEVLTKAERVSRTEMIYAANQYFEGMEMNTGNVIPFDDACNRTENGVQTTNNPDLILPGAGDGGSQDMSCKGQFNSGGVNIFSTPERRFWMVDEQRGIVIGVFMFNIKGQPFVIPIAEAFKIKHGRIYEIEAAMVMEIGLPTGAMTGW